jgi:hypothetical protein
VVGEALLVVCQDGGQGILDSLLIKDIGDVSVEDLEKNEKASRGRVMRSRVKRVVATDFIVIFLIV